MTSEQFLKSLEDKGYKVQEENYYWRCTSPDGKEYHYVSYVAVQFGTWFDVDKNLIVNLPESETK